MSQTVSKGQNQNLAPPNSGSEPVPFAPVHVDPADMVNLGQYVQVLIDWWKEIVLLAVVAGIVAGVAVGWKESKTIKKYRAVSTVAIARVKTDVSFDERFRTLSAEDGDVDLTNAGSRRAALVGLVNNSLVAAAVIEELEDILSESEKNPANLLAAIHAEIIEGLTARTEGDLILIRATSDSPTKAAAIANAWSKHYVTQVNHLYGQVPAEIVASINQELIDSKAAYERAQRELETFVATNQMGKLQRLIDEKKGIIHSLQSAKQIAIDTIVEEELNSRRQIISAYMGALSSNRLYGFNKEQEAQRKVLDALFEAEVENRLEALKRDREARGTLFEHLSNAFVASTTAVVDEEVQSRIDHLHQAYNDQIQLTSFLNRAHLIRNMLKSTETHDVESTGRSLALLKAQLVYLPNNTGSRNSSFADRVSGVNGGTTVNIAGGEKQPVQLNLDIALENPGDAESQLVDVNGLIEAIELQLREIDHTINQISQELLAGDNYPQIDRLLSTQTASSPAELKQITDPENELVSSADVEAVYEFELGMTQDKTDVATAAESTNELPAEQETDGQSSSLVNDVPGASALSRSIADQYADLLSVGDLVVDNSELWKDSALLNQIISLYPELYQLGPISGLSEDVPVDNPLTVLSLEKAQDLLQLKGLEDLPAYTAAAEPIIRAIDKLETEIQALQAALEAEQSQERQLLQNRDLTWGAFSTTNNKVTELELARSITNSEVRLAAPAVEPVSALPGANVTLLAIIATVGGLVLGVGIAYFAWFLGYEPFLRRSRSRAGTSAPATTATL